MVLEKQVVSEIFCPICEEQADARVDPSPDGATLTTNAETVVVHEVRENDIHLSGPESAYLHFQGRSADAEDE